MRYFIPTTRGLRMVEDNQQQCWVAWYCKKDGNWYNEFTGTEEECKKYISARKDQENYTIRYNEFD